MESISKRCRSFQLWRTNQRIKHTRNKLAGPSWLSLVGAVYFENVSLISCRKVCSFDESFNDSRYFLNFGAIWLSKVVMTFDSHSLKISRKFGINPVEHLFPLFLEAFCYCSALDSVYECGHGHLATRLSLIIEARKGRESSSALC